MLDVGPVSLACHSEEFLFLLRKGEFMERLLLGWR
jgi:hypothetical protein